MKSKGTISYPAPPIAQPSSSPRQKGSPQGGASPDLWDALEKAMDASKQKPPPNSFTVIEFARRYNFSRAHAASKLVGLLTLGKLERVRIDKAHYYRLIEVPK